MRECVLDGCTKPVADRGRRKQGRYCSLQCYGIASRGPRVVPPVHPECQLPGCNNRVKSTSNRFCSRACGARNRKKKELPTCALDGCTNKAKRPHMKFCSRGCAAICTGIKRRVVRPGCALDGCTNRVGAAGHKYCSAGCSRIGSRGLKGPRVVRPECPRPGCDNRASKSGASYCSHGCYLKHRKEKKEERSLETRECVLGGCTNRVKRNIHDVFNAYCSAACRGQGTYRLGGRLVVVQAACRRDGCDNRVRLKCNKYCSVECATAAVHWWDTLSGGARRDILERLQAGKRVARNRDRGVPGGEGFFVALYLKGLL
jgi:hypothetical protein